VQAGVLFFNRKEKQTWCPGGLVVLIRVTANQKIRNTCFVIEGLNSFATILYFNCLYFFMQTRFGFGDKRNLLLAALLGLTYTVAAWQAGKFARRFGYFTALKTGFGLMTAGLVVGSQLASAPGVILAAMVTSIGMCFIWPTLEALVSESETPAGVPRAVGIYNIVWAATNALAFFIGVTLVKKIGFNAIVVTAIVIVLAQLVLTFWLASFAKKNFHAAAREKTAVPPPDPNRPSPARAKTFLRMAWLANPFAYIAINTLIAVTPGLDAKFRVSPMFAGCVWSLWCFARLGAFVVLWRWTAWHYRFRWLAGAFAMLVLSFAAILLSPNLAVLIAAQIFFGVAIGLIYYSSLFYSMDASEVKSEHGGIHEAAIGVGNCVGPAMGAAALQFLPQYADSGAIAVSVLLLCGFGGLVGIWKTGQKN
jgi:predicted MFS family arabinose efflux permease